MHTFSKLQTLIVAIFIFKIIFLISYLQASPRVGVLSVNVSYPSNRIEWLGQFIHDELSLQLQLSGDYSVISPRLMSRWNKRLENSFDINSNSTDLKNTEISLLQPDLIFRISLQKVLEKISVNWIIIKFGENQKVNRMGRIYSLKSPDDLIASLLIDLKNEEDIFKDINHHPFNYSWEGIQSFYQWRKKSLPKVDTISWKEYKNEMETLLLSYPEMSSKILYYRAVLNIFDSIKTDPANVPLLNSAENDILDSMRSHPGNGDHHNLLSLVHFLRKETFFAKQQANIASKINDSNGLSFILYGLTIGKIPQAGEHYIKKGLRLYPFLADSSTDNNWQPYNILIRDLEPWLISKNIKNKVNYDNLMREGYLYYNDRIWEKSKKFFEDASSLEPLLPEPRINLAKIYLAQKKYLTGLSILKKLRNEFPNNSDISLYLGFANEKLKFFRKAESLYRSILYEEPKNHKALLRLSSVLIKLGKLEEAKSFLENLTQKYPFYTVAWWNLGIAYYQLGDTESAEIAWEESLRLEPENGKVRLILEQLRESFSLNRFQNL